MGIYVADGREGKIFTGTLPSGDYTIKGRGDAWFVDTARSVAVSNGGTWNDWHKNWIVPERNRERAISALQAACRQIG